MGILGVEKWGTPGELVPQGADMPRSKRRTDEAEGTSRKAPRWVLAEQKEDQRIWGAVGPAEGSEIPGPSG